MYGIFFTCFLLPAVFYSTFVDAYLFPIREIGCFNTAMYYYSNRETGGMGKLYFSYKNDDFRHITFNLDCKVSGKLTYIIRVEQVNLMLPATMQEFCVESSYTSFTECKYNNKCTCCEKPRSVCQRSAYPAYDECNGKANCQLTVASEFLEDCPGREYECEHRKCHSRWAEVIYRCEPVPDATVSNLSASGTGGESNSPLMIHAPSE